MCRFGRLEPIRSGYEEVFLRASTWRVAVLLFASGCCALVYQIGWLRDFRLIFGASTAASAAVLAIFVGGLGIGGLVLGPRADRHPRPLLLYSQLESIVAVSAALSPFLLSLTRSLYMFAGGTPRLGLIAGTIVRLALSAIVLALPTIVMGGTLPAAANAVTRQADVRRQDVAALYALNTLGAVAGCLAATFYMLEVFGTRQTLWLAAAVNLLIAIIARQLNRSMAHETAPAESSERPAHPPATTHDAPVPFVLAASGLVGFAFFLMELVWYRMLGPLLGGSVFTFGLILAVALVGIGLGGLAYAMLGSGRPASIGGFAFTCLLEGTAVALPFALGDRIAMLAFALFPLGHVTFIARIAAWSLVTAIVVLPPAAVAGYQFPLLIALLGRGRTNVGRQIGLAYLANTLGAITGSLAGGFGLLPWLSAPGVWRLLAGALVGLGITAAIQSIRRGVRDGILAQAGLAAAALLLIAATGPTAVWRHSGIGAGRADIALDSYNQTRDWMNTERRLVKWEGDGLESSVSLSIVSVGYAFIVNGKSDGSARGDAATQVMLGLTGALLQPNARRSLVIGLGTGSTAGWLAAVPSMERVDVVELEPTILDVARACRDVNHDALANPKVNVTIGDARETLLTAGGKYDIIASEPSNPFRAGVSSLFTREYYEAALDRLTDQGLFVQWVQAYEIDTRTMRSVYRTLASVFPHVEVWQGAPADLFFVASRRQPGYSVRSLAARAQEEPFRTALRVAWRSTSMTGLLAHFVANDKLSRTIVQVPTIDINTDDRNIVEFGFGRAVGSHNSVVAALEMLARSAGADRPLVDDAGGIDWDAVRTAWIGFRGSEHNFGSVAPEGPRPERARQAALLDYFESTNPSAARAAWAEQDAPPRDVNELAMVADVDAEAGSDRALPEIAALRALEPAEADVILGTLRFRQGRYDEAAAALESAFERFRTDPWPLLRYKKASLALAESIGDRRPDLAKRMVAALAGPFSLQAVDSERLVIAAFLTRGADFKGLCRDAIARLEPSVPWQQEFLQMRRDCYAAVGDSRLSTATRDLREYLEHESPALGAGIPTETP